MAEGFDVEVDIHAVVTVPDEELQQLSNSQLRWDTAASTPIEDVLRAVELLRRAPPPPRYVMSRTLWRRYTCAVGGRRALERLRARRG